MDSSVETVGKLSKTLKFDFLRGRSAVRSKSNDLRSEKFLQNRSIFHFTSHSSSLFI